jgi:hypothetical protein
VTRAALHVASVAEGLALEAEAFAAPGASARLWTSRAPALVCPAAFCQKPGFGDAAARSAKRGRPVHLRPTGGGAVPQGPGVLNLALCFTAAADFSVEAGYRLITGVIRDALAPHGAALAVGATPRSFCDGAWNLSVRGRKVVGAAQRIRPLGGGARRVLAHALILADGDIRPGAEAVNAFHAGLSLPPVAAEAHTTLAAAFGQDAAAFADRLAASARASLRAPALHAAA